MCREFQASQNDSDVSGMSGKSDVSGMSGKSDVSRALGIRHGTGEK